MLSEYELETAIRLYYCMLSKGIHAYAAKRSGLPPGIIHPRSLEQKIHLSIISSLGGSRHLSCDAASWRAVVAVVAAVQKCDACAATTCCM